MDGSGAGVREAALGPAGRVAPARYGITLPTLTRDQFDLGEMFRMLRRRRGIILGTIGVVTLAAILLVKPQSSSIRGRLRSSTSRP
jgi:hypothetical protein